MGSSSYFSTKEVKLSESELSEAKTEEMYAAGFVFTRLGKGVMNQTRSLRLNLVDFKLSSENKRILKKNEGLSLEAKLLPYQNYSWEIHKLGKDYYERKFGDKVMSASKIKEMFTNMSESNMNTVFEYKDKSLGVSIGYCLSYKTSHIFHYAYPFYDLDYDAPNLGMGMILEAIEWSRSAGLDYMYLGSVVEEKSKYKLQFNSLEWFDTETEMWDKDISKLKALIS